MKSPRGGILFFRCCLVGLILYGTLWLGFSSFQGTAREDAPTSWLAPMGRPATEDQEEKSLTYAVDWGGEKLTTHRRVSQKSPTQLLEEYKNSVEKTGGRLDFYRASEKQAAAGATTTKGEKQHVMAFLDKSGRTSWFESTVPARAAAQSADEAVDLPVPLPQDCVKIFALNNSEDSGRQMALYTCGTMDVDGMVDYFKHELGKESWKEDVELYDELQRENLEPVLSFSKSGMNCLISLLTMTGDKQLYVSILVRNTRAGEK